MGLDNENKESGYVATSPVTISVVFAAIISGVAKVTGVTVTSEEALIGLGALALVVNTISRNRDAIVEGIRSTKQFLRDMWDAAKS